MSMKASSQFRPKLSKSATRSIRTQDYRGQESSVNVRFPPGTVHKALSLQTL